MSGSIAAPAGAATRVRPIRLTPPLAVPATGHGAALGLAASDLDDLIAYLRSL